MIELCDNIIYPRNEVLCWDNPGGPILCTEGARPLVMILCQHCILSIYW